VKNDGSLTGWTTEMGLDDLKHEAHGNGGIEGVAVFFQNAEADRRGQPVSRSGNAEGTDDFRAGGEVGHRGSECFLSLKLPVKSEVSFPWDPGHRAGRRQAG
jgi:hypothetical protein